MPVPTGVEREIYKHPVKSAETRVLVQVDEPVFTGFFDDFSGTGVNEQLWDVRNYSWGLVQVSGGTLLLGTQVAAIATPYLASKPRIAFPRRKDRSWAFRIRLRFPNIYSHGNFIMIGSLETSNRVLSIEVWDGGGGPGGAAKLEGLGEIDLVANGVSLGNYFRVQVSYDPITNTQSLWLDENDDGVYTFKFSGSATNRHPDQIVIGNSVAIQGGLADWTRPEIDWVQVEGNPEEVDLPAWAGGTYRYDATGYETELWMRLPTVLGWESTHHKRNQTDALTVDLATIEFRADYPGVDWGRLYADYHFCGREIVVDTRVRDGLGRWTSWKRQFTGIIDEQSFALNAESQTVLQIRARDVQRRRLAEYNIIALSFGDDTPLITGVVENKTAAQAIEYLLQQEVGLAPSQFYVEPCAACLKPKTWNIADRNALSEMDQFREQLAYCWYPRQSDGKLLIQDWFWGTGVADYSMSTREEIESINWATTAWRYVAGVVFSIDNTEFQNGGFSTRYPISALPFHGETLNISSRIVPDDACLRLGRPLQYLSWRVANRELGSIEITTTCQDWFEHDIEIAVLDDHFLNLRKDTVWIIDGWRHSFSGTQFTNTVQLVREEMPDLVRDSVLANRSGWQ